MWRPGLPDTGPPLSAPGTGGTLEQLGRNGLLERLWRVPSSWNEEFQGQIGGKGLSRMPDRKTLDEFVANLLEDLDGHTREQAEADVPRGASRRDEHRVLAPIVCRNNLPDLSPSVTIINDRASLKTMVAVVRAARAVALKVKTTGDDPIENKIVGIALAVDGQMGWYVPVDVCPVTPVVPQLRIRLLLKALQHLFDDGERVLVAHDATFTLGALRAAGLVYRGSLFDTKVTAHLVEPDKPCEFSAVAQRRLGVRLRGDHPQDDQPTRGDQVGACCVEEACAAIRLYRDLAIPVLDRFAQVYALEMRFIPVLVSLHACKYPVDVAKARELRDEVRAEVDELKQELQKVADREINWRSEEQVRDFVYGNRPGSLGMAVPPRSGNGERSTKREALLRMKNQSPLVVKVARLRALITRLSHYLEPIADAPGHIRCCYDQCIQVTGRVSCLGSPNLGLVPNDEPEVEIGGLPSIRSLFVAPRGFVIVKIDYAGQELAILAALAGEESMIDAIRRGEDVHGQVAVRIFGLLCAPEEVKVKLPEKRSSAKSIQFGIVYGMETRGLAQRLGISEGDAETIIRRYFQEYPAIHRYLERVKKDALRQGRVTDPSGRVRLLPALHDPRDTKKARLGRQAALREARNYAIQTFGGVVLREAAIAIHSFLEIEEPDAKLLTLRHDEIQTLVPTAALDRVVPRLKALAEGVDLSAYGIAVPLRVEVEVGTSWAMLTPWNGRNAAGHLVSERLRSKP